MISYKICELFRAAESLRDAAQTVTLVAGYLPEVAESAKLTEYAAHVSTTRQRLDVLEQSMLREGANSP